MRELNHNEVFEVNGGRLDLLAGISAAYLIPVAIVAIVAATVMSDNPLIGLTTGIGFTILLSLCIAI